MTNSRPEGFMALPASGHGRGVLLLHAWWGLNDTMKAYAKRLAEAGFVVFAPDLYHGKIARTIPEAEALGQALDAEHQRAKDEIAAATRYLGEQVGEAASQLAVIGFSLGAFYALDLSAAAPEHIRTVVLYYGTGDADYSRSRAAYLGHFAEDDPYEPPENVAYVENALKGAGRPVTFYRYSETGHWFSEPDRLDAYNEAAAELAWERTLAFLGRETD